MDCSIPGSSVHGILHARILEWVAIPFPRGSSPFRDWTWVFCISGTFFTIWATREAPILLKLRIIDHILLEIFLSIMEQAGDGADRNPSSLVWHRILSKLNLILPFNITSNHSHREPCFPRYIGLNSFFCPCLTLLSCNKNPFFNSLLFLRDLTQNLAGSVVPSFVMPRALIYSM